MKKNIPLNRIRELREDRDLLQFDLAKAIDIDAKTISNYETGKTNPDSYAIIQLAEFFGVTCDYLLGVSDRNIKDNDGAIAELEDIKKRLDGVQRYMRKK